MAFIGTNITPVSDLKFIKGNQFTIGESIEGSVVVVEFWATWCPPCRTSIPHLTEVQKKFKDQGLIIVGVTKENDEAKIKKFVDDMGDKMDYTVAIDVNESANKAIFVPSQARGIPHAIILIGNEVVWAGHPMEESFEEEIASALQKVKT